MALHCAATLLVARHGDADYDHPHVLSDSGGWLTETGKEQSKELAAALADRRVASVYSSTLNRAVESAEVASEVLGVRAKAVKGLEEFSAGTLAGRPHDDPGLRAVFDQWIAGNLQARIPGAESGEEVIGRYREALESIADLHRGETVLVFSHGGVMSLVLPRLSANVRDDLALRKFLPNCAPAEVEVGDDGYQVISWPGTADPSVV
jgi:2,3-bisphosphoglycerate-dependent phosphoglycerate mutase